MVFLVYLPLSIHPATESYYMVNELTDRRLALRDLNFRAAAGESVFPLAAKTDSSLKKNTSFVKRVRSINSDNIAQALADVHSLSLEKYLSEISVSISDALINTARNDDSMPYLEVLCALYQRFGSTFIAPVLSSLINFCIIKNAQEPLPRHKFVLKFVFNMQLVGLCSTLTDCCIDLLSDDAGRLLKLHGQKPIIIALLRNIMAFEPKLGNLFSVISSFGRAFSDVLKADSILLPKELQATSLSLFTLYTQEIIKILDQLRKDTRTKKERLRKASIRTGKLLEDLQEQVDAAEELENTFEVGTTILCDIVGVELPNKEELEVLEDHISVESSIQNQFCKQDCWDDSHDRDFHQIVPSQEEVVNLVDRSSISKLAFDKLTEGERVVKFLTLLESAASELDILLCTLVMKEFVPYNKATRFKLLKFFTHEAKKIDNVNLYARFLKINEDRLAEVISDLSSALDQGFRSQIHHGRINFRIISFFVELVKFKLIPKHVVFHKVRKLTLDLAGTNNALILLIFYQDCGKFLLFDPEYMETTKDMLDLLQLRSKSASLSVDEKHVIRNMFFVVDSFVSPKPRLPVKESHMSPIQDYISQIVKTLVTPEDFSVARLLLFQEIDFFNDREAQDAFCDVFRKPEDLRADCYGLLAKLLCNGGKKRKFLAARIVNILVELVYRGLENNDYRNNASRTSQVKLLAAFFNRGVLSFRSMVDILYRIVCFGHANNLPTPNSMCDIDPPNNFFRLSLCCSMLKDLDYSIVKSTKYFDGSVNSLEGFSVFLQYYSYCKVRPLPKDINLALLKAYADFESQTPGALDLANNFADALAILQAYAIRSGNGASEQSTLALGADSVDFSKELFSESDSFDDLESAESSSDDSDNESGGHFDDDDDEEDDDYDNDEKSIQIGSESDSELVYSVSDPEFSNFEDDEEDEEDEEQKRISERLEALKVAEEKKLISAVDKSIQELRLEAHNSNLSRALRMPAASVLAARVGANTARGPGMRLNFLSKSNRLHEINMPSSKLLDERISREQAEKKANQQKIMSLVDQMN